MRMIHVLSGALLVVGLTLGISLYRSKPEVPALPAPVATRGVPSELRTMVALASQQAPQPVTVDLQGLREEIGKIVREEVGKSSKAMAAKEPEPPSPESLAAVETGTRLINQARNSRTWGEKEASELRAQLQHMSTEQTEVILQSFGAAVNRGEIALNTQLPF